MFADGANALTGLAAALGNYTGYITTNNDGRGIATGFLVKEGTTATNGRLISRERSRGVGQQRQCDLYPGKLFDRAPYALDLKKGDLVADGDEQSLLLRCHTRRSAAVDKAGGKR